MSPSQLAVPLLLALVAAACGPSGEVPPPKQPEPTLTAPQDEHKEKTHLATLVVESSPSGMPVLLNGKPSGKTPATIEDLPAGNYDVTYKDEANGDVTMPVALGEGEYRTIKHNVVPRADRPPPADAKH